MALYDIREMVEGNAAYIAANTITDDYLEQMKELILVARKARKAGDAVAAFEADNLFHETIVRATGNNYLINMYKSLEIWIRRYQRSLIAAQKYDVNTDLQTEERHIVIYRAIKNRYSMVAMTEMQDHLHQIYRVLFNGGPVTRALIESEEL